MLRTSLLGPFRVSCSMVYKRPEKNITFLTLMTSINRRLIYTRCDDHGLRTRPWHRDIVLLVEVNCCVNRLRMYVQHTFLTHWKERM